MTINPTTFVDNAVRYVAYSLASDSALTFAGSAPEALGRTSRYLIAGRVADNDFVLIFTTRSKDELYRFDAGQWPLDAEIVFRGANELAQRYRAIVT
jgi:hypothetical protein